MRAAFFGPSGRLYEATYSDGSAVCSVKRALNPRNHGDLYIENLLTYPKNGPASSFEKCPVYGGSGSPMRAVRRSGPEDGIEERVVAGRDDLAV